MTKFCGAFILIWGLISLDFGHVYAEPFSSKTPADIMSGLSSVNNFQIAEADLESEASDSRKVSHSEFESRFAKGLYEFGLSMGYGFTFNLPPVDSPSDERTRIRFAHFSPNFKYNVTGPIFADGFYRGVLYWVIEAQFAVTVEDPTRNGQVVDDSPNFLFGIVPAQLEYRFINLSRSWAPFLFAGIGGSWSEWFQQSREISTAFEFILQAGAGIEYYFDNGTAINFNYRLWHLSNSNIKSPNTGLNAHLFSLGFSF